MTDPLSPPPTSPPAPQPHDWTRTGAILGLLALIIAFLDYAVPFEKVWNALFPKEPAISAEAPPPAQPPVEGVGTTTSSPVEEVGPANTDLPEPPETLTADERPDPWDLLYESAEDESGPVESPPIGKNPVSDRGSRVPPAPRWPEPKPDPKPEVPKQEAEETVVETPNPPGPPIVTTPGEEPGTGQEEVSRVEDELVVRYVNPEGPQILGEIAKPQLPADALHSLAAGKQLVVRVWVTTDGKARVTAIDAPWLPGAIQQRVRELLERRAWRPGIDRSGVQRASEAVVVFSWEE